MFFARWFTDSFLRASREDFRQNTSTQEIDLCQIYGLGAEQTRTLRSTEAGPRRAGLLHHVAAGPPRVHHGKELTERHCVDPDGGRQMDVSATAARGLDAHRAAATSKEPRNKRLWAIDVNIAVDVMEARLASSKAASAWTPAQAALEPGLLRRLAAARAATLRHDPVPGHVSNWWRGTLIETAYENLHAAEALMAAYYTPEEMAAEIPEAVARVDAGLDRDDPRRVAVQDLLESPMTEAVRRAELLKAIEIGFSASDAEFTRLRRFRNTVLAGAAAMTVLMILFGMYVHANPSDVPFCFAPTRGDVVCASGGSAPAPHDVVAVALLGTLGGLLATILAIRKMEGSSGPYNVGQALAVLKLPLGAMSAVGGLIAIRGDFIPGFSQLDTQAQILAYAFAFGFAQQLLTGLIDRQATTILSRTPGKSARVTRPLRIAPARPPSTLEAGAPDADVADTGSTT
ncbi:hypothetical protein GCM10027596_30700 [Nocardioides korecus]